MTKRLIIGCVAIGVLLISGCGGAQKSNQEWIKEAAFAYVYDGSLNPASLEASAEALMGVSRSPDGGAASDALHDSGRHYQEAAVAAEAGSMGAVGDALEAAADDMDRANALIEKMGGFDSIQ